MATQNEYTHIITLNDINYNNSHVIRYIYIKK